MQFADEVKVYTCIRCPLGCQVEVAFDDTGKVSEVAGYSCIRGKEYALEESCDPRRMVTALVNVQGCLEPLSVKTSEPIPKDMIDEVIGAIHALRVKAPIHAGEVLIEDVCGTGAAIIATKSSQ